MKTEDVVSGSMCDGEGKGEWWGGDIAQAYFVFLIILRLRTLLHCTRENQKKERVVSRESGCLFFFFSTTRAGGKS